MKPEELLLKQLMSIPSVSGNETEIGEFIFTLLKKEGFNVTRQTVDKKRFNVIAKLGNPQIYLQAHMDTVPPFIPYSADETYIYGRGACDTKASIATMITAAIQCKQKGYSNFGLLFTTAEETDFDGAKKVIENKLQVPFIIVGEPTSLDIVNGHFGLNIFNITAKGKSAHSSRPEQGINAIDILSQIIAEVKKIKVHPETLISLVQINGGVADNIIPEFAEATFSMRISPNDKQDYNSMVKKFLPKNSQIEVKQNIGSVYCDIPDELSFIQTRRSVKYFTELSFFKKGVVIGPGDILYAHGANEKIIRSELPKAVKIYSQIIKNYCLDSKTK
ncbi:MAG TPA: M20/M25/M40 family metallo-hydrolase [Patescibacteria group bacterium]|nr:M20/M25/M40 family metallo-hydrolase [Patescibacteria group bacterium]